MCRYTPLQRHTRLTVGPAQWAQPPPPGAGTLDRCLSKTCYIARPAAHRTSAARHTTLRKCACTSRLSLSTSTSAGGSTSQVRTSMPALIPASASASASWTGPKGYVRQDVETVARFPSTPSPSTPAVCVAVIPPACSVSGWGLRSEHSRLISGSRPLFLFGSLVKSRTSHEGHGRRS